MNYNQTITHTMTNQRKFIFFSLLFFSTSLTALAQTQTIITTGKKEITIQAQDTIGGTGYVNFNLGPYPAAGVSPKTQTVSLYGCNTVYTTDTGTWNGIHSLSWDTDNQVLSKVPYGYRMGKNYPYYISKYYMASPPVFHSTDYDKDTTVTIGLVLPDHFTFFGDLPVEVVHLDYNILQSVYLNFVSANFDYNDSLNTQSCAAQGVNFIPINIECTDFPWDTQNITTYGKGASGIGSFQDSATLNRVFLPSIAKDSNYLNCSVTLLDDIMPDYEVFFSTTEGLIKQIDLTTFYKTHQIPEDQLNLVCIPRTEPPSGCIKN